MLGSPPRLPAYKARGSVLLYSPQQRKQSEEKQSNHLCEKKKKSFVKLQLQVKAEREKVISAYFAC